LQDYRIGSQTFGETAAAAISPPPPLPSSSCSGMRNLDGWMDDRTDDRTNGWKGRPERQTPKIIYI
jgi:hypothetical protein